MKKAELITTSILLLVTTLIVGYITTQMTDSKFGLYEDISFWENVIVEAHGMILDLLIVGVILIMILNRIEKKKNINELIEKIEFNRNLKTDEAKYTLMSAIRILNKMKVYKLDLHQCSLSKLIMTNINVSGSSIHAVDFYETNLKSSTFTSTNGVRTIFDCANIKGVDFNNSKFKRSNFNKVNARGSNFKECNITKSQFSEADLNNVDFRGCIINDTNFSNADLTNADFRDCEFSGNMTFDGALLQSSNFEGAKNLPFSEIIKAKSLKKTKFDEEIIIELRRLNANLDL